MLLLEREQESQTRQAELASLASQMSQAKDAVSAELEAERNRKLAERAQLEASITEMRLACVSR